MEISQLEATLAERFKNIDNDRLGVDPNEPYVIVMSNGAYLLIVDKHVISKVYENKSQFISSVGVTYAQKLMNHPLSLLMILHTKGL